MTNRFAKYADPAVGSQSATENRFAKYRTESNETERERRGLGGVVRDLGVSAGVGVSNLVGTGGAMYGVATGNYDNAAARAGERGREHFDSLKSPQLKALERARQAKVDAVDNEWLKGGIMFWETVKSPTLWASFLAEQAPMLVPGAAVGRALSVGSRALGAGTEVATAAGVAGSLGTGAAMHGSESGATAYDELLELPDELWEQNDDLQRLLADGLNFDDAKVALAERYARNAAGQAGSVSLLTNVIPGSRILERRLVGGRLTGSRTGNAARGFIGETAQEAIEEGTGAAFTNLAVGQVDPEREWSQDVGESSGMGALSGPFGAAAGAVRQRPEPQVNLDTEDGGSAPVQTAEDVAPIVNPYAENQSITPAEFTPQSEMIQPAPFAPLRSTMNPEEAQAFDALDAERQAQLEADYEAAMMQRADQEVAQATEETERQEVLGRYTPEAAPANPAMGNALLAAHLRGPESQAAGQVDAEPEPTPTPASQEGPVLQNRDRATQASIEQMQQIASRPDYHRAGFSRMFSDGAPVIEPGVSVAPQNMGRSDTATTAEGRRIPIQYAVVEADQLVPSHRADGTRVPEYEAAAEGRSRAVAGNGRIAGLQRGYELGTTEEYMQGMIDDEALHGVSASVIRNMRKPILVRIMPEEEITANIADESNTRATAALTPAEQARADARRVNVDAIELSEDGEITRRSVEGFIQAMPQSERAGLMDNGQPNRQAHDQLNSLLFRHAFDSDALLRLHAEAVDPEARTIMSALRLASAKLARLKGQGVYDIRGLVEEAAETAVNARRSGEALSDFIQQTDMARNPEIDPILRMMAVNIRSAKRIAEHLTALADLFYNESQRADVDMFGTVQKRSREELMGEFYGNESGPTNTQDHGELRRSEPDGTSTEGAETQRAEPRSTEPAARSEQDEQAPQEVTDFDLEAETEQDVRRRETEARTRQQTEDRAAAAERSRADADAQRSDFRLSGSTSSSDTAASYGQSDMLMTTRARVDQAATDVDTSPTEAQKEAGNYRKGHTTIQGLDITIENPRGSTRSGTDADGNRWENTMAHHYGYIKRTKGADGEHVDVFIGPNPDSETVFLIDQVNPDNTFDEHKVMIGFDSEKDAVAGYKGNYARGWKVGPVSQMTMSEFKTWLSEGNIAKPFSNKVIARNRRPDKPRKAARQAASQEAVSVSGAPVFSRAQAEKGNLYVGHNLSESNLFHADELGGLAAPSLAVARTEFGFDGFGEITLLAGPQLLESSKVKTFDADVYSPRHPRAQYTLNERKYDAFVESLGQTYGLDIPDADSLSSKGADALLYSDAAKLAFLREQGKEPKTKSRKPSIAVRKIANMEGTKWDKLRSPEVQKLAAAHFDRAAQQLFDSLTPERQEKFGDPRNEYFTDGKVKDFYLRNLVDDAQMLAEQGDVDKSDLSAKIRKAFKTRKAELAYQEWAREKFNEIKNGARIFKGFTNSGNRRYVDYNLTNIVKEMTASLQGGENFNYGAGSVRSAYSKRLSSVKAVQKNRDKIISAKEFEALKTESNDKLVELLDKLKPYYKFDASGWGYMDDASQAIAEGPRGLREAFDLDAEARQDVQEFVDYLANMPTSYFEAKAQRAVDLSEFSVAVVPTGTSQKAKDILKSKGLKIVTYKQGDDEARRAAIAKQSKVLFSRNSQQSKSSMPLDRAQVLVSAITGRMNNAPVVTVVQNMQDERVPEVVRREDARQRSQGAGGDPEGFYYQGQAYIVLDGLARRKGESDAQAVFRVFAHEVLGHAGLRGLFRNDLTRVLNEVALKRSADVRKKAEEYGLDISKRDDRLVAAEEVLAEMAQSEPENSIVTKAVEAVRRALRGLFESLPESARQALEGGKFMEWVNSLSDAEIIDRFIVPAREYIRTGATDTSSRSPVFQRGGYVSAGRRVYTGSRTIDSESQLDLFDRLDQANKGDPYDNIESRPGTTEKQKQAGRSALRDLFRQLTDRYRRWSGDRSDRAEISVLGAAIYENFVAGKPNQLIGQTVESPADLAALAQVYRDPRFETFRIIFTEGDKVVGESAYSSRMPSMVAFSNTIPDEIRSDRDRLGADGYYMLHNHPSGVSTPSRPDIRFTTGIADAVPGFRSHVVIDTNEYSTINRQGEVNELRMAKDFGGRDFWSDPAVPHPLLGQAITSPEHLSGIAKQLETRDKHVIIGTAGGESARVVYIVGVPTEALNADPTQAVAALLRIRRALGSGGRTFLITAEKNPDPNSAMYAAVARSGLFTDIVSSDGDRSFANLGRMAEERGLEDRASKNAQSKGSRVAEPSPSQENQIKSATGNDTIEVDGQQRPTTNSNGQPIAQTEQGVRNFWRWFGDSLVVDEQGRPLVVYHGTGASFDTFITEEGAERYHFTKDPSVASEYAGGQVAVDLGFSAPNVMPTYVSLQNPLVFDADGGQWSQLPLDSLPDDIRSQVAAEGQTSVNLRDITHAAQNAGYDGVIARNIVDPAGPYGDNNPTDVFVAFSNTQIKSAIGNRGTFDPDNPDTRFSRSTTAPAVDSGAFADLTDAQRSLMSKIGRPPTTVRAKQWVSDRLDRIGTRIRHGLVDRYAALKELDEKLHGRDFINTAITDSAWVLAKMSSAGSGALSAMMSTGRITYDADQKLITLREGDRTGGLMEVLSQLGPAAEVERFLAWVASNRAKKLMAEGRENLFTASEIDAGVLLNTGNMENGQSRSAAYNRVFLQFQQFRDDVLSIAEATGIISEEHRSMWRDEFYVPFYRVMEEDAAQGPGNSKGLSRQEAFKRLKGGRENINDLLENTLMNFHHLLSASLKNQAAQQAIKNASEMGIAERVSESARNPKTSTFVLEKGRRVFYEISDPLVYEALTMMADPGLNNAAVKTMGAFKRIFTQMTTITPQFIIANTLRDLGQAVATSPTSYNPLRNAIEGLSSYRNDKIRAEMLASGASFSFGHIYGADANEVKASLNRAVRGSELIADASLVPEIVKAGWRQWNKVADTSENIARAATYQQNVERHGRLRAAHEARDIMDFTQHGAWPAVRFLVRVVPFLNARIQGLDKIYRSGVKPSIMVALGEGTTSDRQAAARFAAVTGALVMASLALYAANMDDEEFQKLEEWQKDTYWFFRVGDHAFFLPKPFEVGAIATLAERTAQQFMDDKATGELFRERLLSMLTETFSFNPVPQLFQPVLDIYSNKDAFTGRQIETAGMERMSKGLRARDTTTAPAHALSSVSRILGDESPIALSPVQADHLIRGYLGSVGASAAGMIDTFWRAANGQAAPAKTWSEYQPIRRFYRDLSAPAPYSRYSTLFYDGLREANRVYADVLELQQLGRLEQAQNLRESQRHMLVMRQSLNRQQRRLGEINRRMEQVRRSDRDAAWKRREIDRLTVMRNQIMEVSGRQIEERRAGSERRN